LFLSVNLASNTFAAGVLADDGNFDSTITTMNYGSDWTFDSTSLVSVCSDYDGSNKIACTVANLKILYAYYSSSAIVNTANSVTLIGDYKLNDGAGSTTMVNSQTAAGSLGSATFCNLFRFLTFDNRFLAPTPPTWTSDDAGLEFTSASQYIKLPAFVPSSADQLISLSVAFTFYIKIDSAPTTDVTIFTYFVYNVKVNFPFILKSHRLQ